MPRELPGWHAGRKCDHKGYVGVQKWYNDWTFSTQKALGPGGTITSRYDRSKH